MRDGQGVGRVGRRQLAPAPAGRAHHRLHLALVRAPLPATACFIARAAYSATGRPAAPSAASATPRAWPSTRAERGFAATKTCSTAATSGACSADHLDSRAWSAASRARAARRAAAQRAVRHVHDAPAARARRRRSRSRSNPGSIPRMRIALPAEDKVRRSSWRGGACQTLGQRAAPSPRRRCRSSRTRSARRPGPRGRRRARSIASASSPSSFTVVVGSIVISALAGAKPALAQGVPHGLETRPARSRPRSTSRALDHVLGARLERGLEQRVERRRPRARTQIRPLFSKR